MNKIKLFGKVEHTSDIKFDIARKLKAYITIQIRSTSEDAFNCIAYERMCEKLRNIKQGEYIYLEGYIIQNEEDKYIIIVDEMYF